MVLPICTKPTAAGPPLQMRGQNGLPARPIFGFSDKAAAELVFNCYPGVCDVDPCKQLLLIAKQITKKAHFLLFSSFHLSVLQFLYVRFVSLLLFVLNTNNTAS